MAEGKKAELIIEVKGADQNEALANAEKEAKTKGYNKISLKNIISITYSAMLYDPIEEEN